MAKAIDLTGKAFGHWLVLARVQNDSRGCAQWLCRCSCRVERVVAGDPLRSGRSTNCGCANQIDPARRQKRCRLCTFVKPIDEFGRSKSAKDGHGHYCRPCLNTRCKWYRRRSKYGLEDKEYYDILVQQRRECASCSDQVDLVVDHDHATGRVRGLLCHPCNKALGFLRDDPARIQGLLTYLRHAQRSRIF